MLILKIIAAIYVGIGLGLVLYYTGRNLVKKFSGKPAFCGFDMPEDSWMLILTIFIWPLVISDLL